MTTERYVSIGGTEYRLEARPRDSQWLATAWRVASGDRFGPGFWGGTAEEATARARAWLEWQHDHREALEALQDAERSYQRALAGSLIATSGDSPTPAELQQETSARLEESRRRLDEIRARRPE